jgi:SNF2 family DNA or RNA helicase
MPAFKAINTLRKLCNHPSLVFQNGNFIWSIEDDIADINESLNNNSSNSNSAPPTPQDIEVSLVKRPLRDFSWDSSGKLIVLSKILPLWFAESNKVLIFSQVTEIKILFCLFDFYFAECIN